MQANLSFLQAEERTASNCSKAWASLRTFESYFPSVTPDAQLDPQYLTNRPQCLDLAKQLADDLGLSAALALDAVLMLDRLVHHQADLFTQVCAHLSVIGVLTSRSTKLIPLPSLPAKQALTSSRMKWERSASITPSDSHGTA